MADRTTAPRTLPVELVIRQATLADAAVVATLGAHLFAQAYGPTHPDPELGEYLARAFRPELVAQAMAERDSAVLLVEELEGGPVGYAQLLPGAALPVPPWSSQVGCEIQRFYLDRQWQGRGVAQELMARSLRHAATAGSELVWLQVWQEAHWAVRFYQRAGFVAVGTTPFEWGSRVETDWLMTRSLKPESAHG
ncbi:MAG: GNAT family N-acetyltransferase [Gemmatimonadota bacterium]|nr:GNAT family N-acetyltransferase [Gemmatimonadota bacterium]